MEDLISAGEVMVNGRRARIGTRVSADDRITVHGELIGRPRRASAGKLPCVVLYHKPEGEIVSRDDPEGRPSVFDRIGFLRRGRWLAIGRLDFNSCGLLLFTDSGELANRLSHPRFNARRDYAVRVIGELGQEQLLRLRSAVTLEDGEARFDSIEPHGGEGSNRWYRIRVREGRNRLIRRMFAAIGVTVSRLMRTAFGPFELPARIKRGQWLRLDEAAVKQALAQLQAMPAEIASPARQARRQEPKRPRPEARQPAAPRPRHRPRWFRST
jgi:23S rRNA pseudouridine2605 synthase